MRLADHLEIAAQRYPDKEGFVYGENRWTFRQARDYAHAIANRLADLPGLAENAHLAILARNDLRVTILQMGINYAGCAWVSLHDRNSASTNAQVANFTDCEVMFFHNALDAEVEDLKTLCPSIRTWICINGTSRHGPSLDSWIEGHLRPFAYTTTRREDIAFIAPTGGTTGPSKGAEQTMRGTEAELVSINARYFLGRKNVRLLTVAPLSHVAGHLAIGLLPSGGTSVILDGFDSEKVLKTIESEKISHLFLPPTALYNIMTHPLAASTDYSSLQMLSTGAAPVAPEKFKEAVRLFGPVVWEGYGQTEALIPLLMKGPDDYLTPEGAFREDVVRSAGRAWEYVRIEIMDEEGNIVPRGERGEIVVRSAYLMKGYYKNPEATDEVLRNGFLHTGDIGVMDENGFVTIVDRKKEMIITGGFNVFPAEVEAVMNEHPAVLDCIVVGVPDEKWGEAIKAVVQLKPGVVVDCEALRLHCRERLGGVKAPKSVEIWPDLPRSAVGKLLRREVRDQYWAGNWRSVG